MSARETLGAMHVVAGLTAAGIGQAYQGGIQRARDLHAEDSVTALGNAYRSVTAENKRLRAALELANAKVAASEAKFERLRLHGK